MAEFIENPIRRTPSWGARASAELPSPQQPSMGQPMACDVVSFLAAAYNFDEADAMFRLADAGLSLSPTSSAPPSMPTSRSRPNAEVPLDNLRAGIEEPDGGNALVLHCDSVYGKLPVTIFSRPLVFKCCHRCTSEKALRRLYTRGWVSLLVALLCLISFASGSTIIILSFLKVIPSECLYLAIVLTTPEYIVWVLLMEERILQLVVRTKLVWLYLLLCVAWTGILIHVLQDSPRVCYAIFVACPGLVLVSFVDAVRHDAVYFRRALPVAYFCGMVVMVQLWFLLVSGELDLHGMPIDFKINLAVSRWSGLSGLTIAGGSGLNGAGGGAGNRSAADVMTTEITLFSEIGFLQTAHWTLSVLIMRFLFLYTRDQFVLAMYPNRRHRRQCVVLKSSIMIE